MNDRTEPPGVRPEPATAAGRRAAALADRTARTRESFAHHLVIQMATQAGARHNINTAQSPVDSCEAALAHARADEEIAYLSHRLAALSPHTPDEAVALARQHVEAALSALLIDLPSTAKRLRPVGRSAVELVGEPVGA